MPGRADGVAHVVQGVEEAGEVEAGTLEGGRAGHRGHPLGHPGVGGRLAGGLDRLGVVIDPDHLAAREGLGDHDRAAAVPAAHIEHPATGLQLRDDAPERGDPPPR